MIQLDAATVLLQWASGGLLFLWVTTRHREVGLGYGWSTRAAYLALAVGAAVAGFLVDPEPVREAASIGVAAAAAATLALSVGRKSAGVSGQQLEHDRRHARVAAMTGIDRTVDDRALPRGPEFPPNLDLVAPLIGAIGLIAAGIAGAGPAWLAVFRNLTGAAFLGAITDAMLLGHWYLVQPGLPRRLLDELVTWVIWLWPLEVLAFVLPVGMLSVLSGSIDDGWNGILGWMWLACAITTLVLAIVTRAALNERYYSAVMAATGLLYLAILTAFGMDLVARAVLA